MQIDTWIEIGGFGFMIITTIIGIAVTWTKQSANIEAVRVEAQNEVRLVVQDLDNHKRNHAALEQRVEKHESKIDEKLESLNGKMDELKTFLIEKFK